MGTTLDKKIAALSPNRRAKVEARAKDLIAVEQTLQDLRKAQNLTQQRIAELLNIGQDSVSRLEKRSDLLLSTLRSYIEAMGGHLRILAEFPDRPAVTLSGFSVDKQEEEKVS